MNNEHSINSTNFSRSRKEEVYSNASYVTSTLPNKNPFLDSFLSTVSEVGIIFIL